MTHTFEPHLQPVEIAELRPTQMTVGFREVSEKRGQWRKHSENDGADYLGRHMVPVIVGPKKRAYLVDDHHLVRALYEEGIVHVLTSVVCDLSSLDKTEFWSTMDCRHWIYPFDLKGERKTHDKLPESISSLVDDPYRSLAGSLRRAGGFAKDSTPYSEFVWANFLRLRIDPSDLTRDYERALGSALVLARSADARHLPGWCGLSGQKMPPNQVSMMRILGVDF